MINVFITNNYGTSLYNGIGSYIEQLVGCFVENEAINVHVIDFYSPADRFSLKCIGGVTHLCFPPFDYGVSLNRIGRVVDTFLRLYVPDSAENVFFFNYHSDLFLMRLLKVSHPKSKQICVVHNMGWTTVFKGDEKAFAELLVNGVEQMPEMARAYKEELEMYSLADCVVCLSQDAFHVLKSLYRVGDKLRHINSGLRICNAQVQNGRSLLRRDFFLGEDELVFLCVGRIDELKGVMALMNAFKRVLLHIANARLVLVGSVRDWKETLQQAYPVSSKITLTGVLNKSEIGKWYRVADVGVIPSYTEQCSYVALEMLAQGLPVVSSDGFGIRNMFVDGRNGIVAAIHNREVTDYFVRNLAEKMVETAQSSQLRLLYGRMNRCVFKQEYSFRQMRENYNLLLQTLFP